MENKKIPEYLDYIVQEIRGKEFICKIKGNEEAVILKDKDFLDYTDVSEGDIWRFYKNSKNNKYSFFSNLFSQDYLKNKFKDKTVYTGIIFSEMRKEWIIKVNKSSYIRIGKTEFINEVGIGDDVEFSIKYNRKGIVRVDLNEPILKKICEKLNYENKDKIKLEILDIQEIGEENNIIGYEYKLFLEEENLKFKLFLKVGYDKINGLESNEYYLKRNYEIFCLNKRESRIYSYFKFDKFKYEANKIFFYLDIFEIFKEILEENNEIEPAELIFNVFDGNFYIERKDIGIFKYNTSRYSLVELNLLETLNKKFIYIRLENKKYINIVPIDKSEEIEEEIENIEIVDRIQTFSKKIIYQLAVTNDKENLNNNRMFIEDREMDYLGEIFPIGYKIEKIRFKYNVKDLFKFYTRLPYIENPLVSILKDKKEGDTLYARVKEIKNNFIEIVVEGKYRKIIPKSKLKNLEKFEIKDYYEENKLAEFYIEEKKENDVTLLGYNPEKIREIFNRIKEPTGETEGDTIECYVKEGIKGLEGIYEERGEVIEVYIPEEEISYLGDEFGLEQRTKFDPQKKYQFKVIRKGLSNNPFGLMLSRKRLSKSVENELSFFPVGSVVGGIFFLEDEEGFYFNLTDKNYKINLGDLVGYLPFNKIGLYPEIEKFKLGIMSNIYTQYKILAYPKKFNSLDIREKAIELEMISPSVSLSDIIKEIGDKDIEIDLSRKNKIKLRYEDEDKIYFEHNIKNEKVVFSLNVKEYDQLESLYKHLNLNKDKEIYCELFKLFKDRNIVELVFEGVNKENNTIELSLNKKIEKILFNLKDIVVEQNIKESLYLSDKVLNIPVVIENRESFLEESQKCKIKNILDGKIILEVFIEEEELLNKQYKVKIKEKIKNGYIGILNNKEVIIDSPFILQKNEEIFCIINKIEGKKIYAKLKIDQEELFNNCGSYINKFIENKINELTVTDLINFLNSGNEKYKYINILAKNREKIYTGYKLGKYLFEKEEFSNGAFGNVYKGIDLLTDKEVILKRYSSDKTLPEYISFQNEAKLLEKLELNSVMKVFYNTENEYVGEYIAGRTYREFLNEERTYSEKLDMIIKIAEAVEDIHNVSVIHLDIKPENIMIDREENVKLIDFGCSQSEYEKYGKLGTLIYSSPSQCISYVSGDTETIFTEKDDIYSFGIMLYETFVGKTPYTNELGDEGIIAGHRKGRIVEDNVEYRYINPREINGDILENLESVINKCLESEEERYESMNEIIFDLEECF